ncbi:MAG: LacI family DNA-binding transcriptional regulator [bacterium]
MNGNNTGSTLRDVAAEAGVSKTIVSWVYHGKAEQHRVSEETQRRVAAVIARRGYVPATAGTPPALPVVNLTTLLATAGYRFVAGPVPGMDGIGLVGGVYQAREAAPVEVAPPVMVKVPPVEIPVQAPVAAVPVQVKVPIAKPAAPVTPPLAETVISENPSPPRTEGAEAEIRTSNIQLDPVAVSQPLTADPTPATSHVGTSPLLEGEASRAVNQEAPKIIPPVTLPPPPVEPEPLPVPVISEVASEEVIPPAMVEVPPVADSVQVLVAAVPDPVEVPISEPAAPVVPPVAEPVASEVAPVEVSPPAVVEDPPVEIPIQAPVAVVTEPAPPAEVPIQAPVVSEPEPCDVAQGGSVAEPVASPVVKEVTPVVVVEVPPPVVVPEVPVVVEAVPVETPVPGMEATPVDAENPLPETESQPPPRADQFDKADAPVAS